MGTWNDSLIFRVRSASDCRLKGWPDRATVSQAMAFTLARSSRGKNGLSATSFPIDHREVASAPTLPPSLDLAGREADHFGGHGIAERWLLVQEQRQPEALN